MLSAHVSSDYQYVRILRTSANQPRTVRSLKNWVLPTPRSGGWNATGACPPDGALANISELNWPLLPLQGINSSAHATVTKLTFNLLQWGCTTGDLILLGYTTETQNSQRLPTMNSKSVSFRFVSQTRPPVFLAS